MAEDFIRILIVDDSALMRKFLTITLAKNHNLKVLATAMNGKIALEKIKEIDFDLIFLDLEMPEMNGIEFLKEKKKLKNNVPVIIFSSIAKAGATITMEALMNGATDYVLKKDIQIVESAGVDSETHNILVKYAISYGFKYKFEKTLDHKYLHLITSELEELKKNGRVENIVETKEVKKNPIIDLTNRPAHQKPEILAIGISTGGPKALRDILPLFPKNFPLPIVIVQHMPKNFTGEFAESLDRISNLNVKEAEDKEIIKPGNVYVAQGEIHMKVSKNGFNQFFISFQDSPAESGHKPSVDVLFESTMKACGGRQIAVIMTGMGKDGSREIGNIYQAGGYTIAQNQETSVVFGMNGVAIHNGYIENVLPLEKIPERIIEIVNQYKL